MGAAGGFITFVNAQHLDEYGHVNYKVFPLLLEPAQDQFMEQRGIGFKTIEDRYRLRSFVAAMSIQYRGQLFAYDVIEILTEVGMGNTSLTYEQRIMRGGELIAEAKLIVVLVDAEGQKIAVPDAIRQAIGTPTE